MRLGSILFPDSVVCVFKKKAQLLSIHLALLAVTTANATAATAASDDDEMQVQYTT